MPQTARAAIARALLAGACLLATTPAMAQFEAGGGVSVTKGSEATAVASAAWLPALRPLARGTLRAELGALYFDGRRGLPGRDLGDGVVVVHAGLRYDRGPTGLTLGSGVGVQSGTTDALSGAPQFVTTLGWRWTRVSLLLRHVSNASLRSPNDGETLASLGWRF